MNWDGPPRHEWEKVLHHVEVMNSEFGVMCEEVKDFIVFQKVTDAKLDLLTKLVWAMFATVMLSGLGVLVEKIFSWITP
jgi:hypothetical protein